ncbi:MAG: hypothetical protein J7K54_03100 [Candidatus Aenigmarchaeota archaeon]|nr:hypothetical protein [Candidatus Aenigmarchaeota archaeon]
MKYEKHREALKEVMDTISKALDDPEGLTGHQRRIISMLSMGTAQLVEMYLHKLRVMKPGGQVKHDWFKQNERNIRLKLSPLLTTRITEIPQMNEILYMASEIEKNRDEIFYGSPLPTDRLLKEKIETFLELKKLVGE